MRFAKMQKSMSFAQYLISLENIYIFFTKKIYYLCFPGGSVVKNLPAVQETWVIPGLGRSPGGENGNTLQYSCLKNPTDRGAWLATTHRVTKELDTTQQINDNEISVIAFKGINMAQMVKNLPAVQETLVPFLGQEDLEKGIATHSSILAWRIPQTRELGGLQSTRSQRVRHN